MVQKNTPIKAAFSTSGSMGTEFMTFRFRGSILPIFKDKQAATARSPLRR